MNFIKEKMKPVIYQFDGVQVQVPIVYNGAQRYVQVRQRSHLVDQNNNPLYPIISFSRTSTKMGAKQINRLGFNTYNSTIQIQNTYSKERPFKRIDSKQGYVPRRSYLKVMMPIPMQCSYQFQIYTNTNQHMNDLIQLFFTYNHRWWFYQGHRVRVDIQDFSNITEIQAASQRMIKSTFTMWVRTSLIPKQSIQQEHPIKKIVTEQKI